MNRRKKLLIVSPSLSQGGAERFTSSLACGLDRDRYELHVCLLRDDITYPIPHDVPITVLHKHQPWHIPRTIRRLRHTMEQWQPDVVLGTITFTNCLIGAARRQYQRPVRCIARFGSAPRQEHHSLLRALTWRPTRTLLCECDLWVANSRRLAGLLSDYYRLPAQRIQTIYTPVDFDGLTRATIDAPPRPSDDAPHILAVGRLARQKRFDLLIEAFARIRKRLPARLTICGDGPLLVPLRHQIDRLNLTEDVRLQPFQSSGYDWLRGADVFALSSDFEGMPNALIEAQSLGLPAVATDCETGPSEIIVDGETGYLVPVGDVDAMTDRLLRLLCDPALRDRMGERAARRVRAMFDPTNTIDEWENTLDATREGVAECVA